MSEPALPPARYEREDLTFGFMLAGAGGVLVLVLLCTFLVMWLYPSSVQDRRLTAALPTFPAPSLQANPHADLMHFEAAELSRLNSTGWIDKSQSVVHIPIGDAMRQIAQQGIADWPTPAGPAPAGPAPTGSAAAGSRP